MPSWKPAALTLALAAAFPGLASAQSNAALLKELKALQDRITELEKKLAEKPAPAPAAAPAPAPAPAPVEKQWGMTPEQLQDFNRIAVKTEATEDNLAAQGFKGLTVSGYMDPAYIFNKRQHRAGFQFLNDQSTFAYDTSYLGSASIDFKKETDSGTIWRLTLNPNRSAGAAFTAGNSIVQEASVSVPLTDPATRLIAGQIPDWSGYEYQQPTLNPFTTHNLLYDFTLPTAYVGAGVDMKLGKWQVKGVIANVNKSIRDIGEKTPAFAYRADYGLSEFAGFGFAGLFGKATNFNLQNPDGSDASTSARLFEVDGYYTRGDWTYQGQVGLGQHKQAAVLADAGGTFFDAKWWGLSGLVGYSLTPRLQLLGRADYINNSKNGGGLFGYTGFTDSVDGRNGLGVNGNCIADPTLADCGKGANRYALTVGVKFNYNPNTTFKAEYRLDGASRAVFVDTNDGTYHKSNQLFGTSVVVSF